ncbi:MAG: nucleotidyltransferase domain-containing protein [Fibromonadaceae bacterium]|nr:nucleotidyltransferase domain-containing protein [Fibromonadaceae bacterium]
MVEESQNDIFLQILKKLEQENVLKELILVGSWCLPIYKEIYGKIPNIPVLRTSDLDLLVRNPRNIHNLTNVDKLLQDMGFIRSFDVTSPLIKYKQSKLDIEFLSARIRGNEKIIKIPQLSITAQVLDYMEIAVQYAMETEYIGINLKIPELPAYVLHKAIVQTLRTNEVKKEKDAATVASLGRLIAELPELQTRTIQIFNKFPKSWQKIVLKMVKIHSPELKELFTRTSTPQ